MKSSIIACLAALFVSQAGEAQNLAYPVGVSSEPPTVDFPNGNGYRITMGFREDGHTGVDLANGTAGGAVNAAGTGTVSSVCFGYCSGFGNALLIRHNIAGGPFYSFYAHLLDNSILVTEGQTVAAGQQIAQVGSTGQSTGPHLHFAIKSANQLGCGYIAPGQCISEIGQEAIYQNPIEFIATPNGSPSFFSDSFELHTSGTFPSAGGWFIRPGASGIGAASQFVTNSGAHAGAQSFQLQSAAGLGVNVQKLIASSAAPATHKLALEAYINTTSATYKNAFIGFGSEGDLSAVVRLMAGGSLASADLTPLAGSYNTSTWIRLRVAIDPLSNRYDVFVNGLRAEPGFSILGNSGAIDRVWIGVDNSGVGGLTGTTAFFDDVSLIDMEP